MLLSKMKEIINKVVRISCFKKNISVNRTLKLLFKNRYYLKDFLLLMMSVKNFEHAIYFEKDFGEKGVFLDLFFNKKELKIYAESFNVIKPNDFIDLIIKNSYKLTIPKSSLKRFYYLPKSIKEKAKYVLSYSQKIINMLQDKSYWFPLNKDKSIYIQKSHDGFWNILEIKDKRINSIYQERENFIKRIYKAVIEDTIKEVEKVPVDILKEINDYEDNLYSILNKIKNGDYYLELYMLDYGSRIERRIVLSFNSKYFSCLLNRERLETFYSIDELNIIDEVLNRLVKKEKVKLCFIDKDLEKELKDKVLGGYSDQKALIKMIKENKAKIGGGITTGQQWIIYCMNGEFYINGRKISEDEVEEIVNNKSYSWIKYEETKRSDFIKKFEKQLQNSKVNRKAQDNTQYKTLWSNLDYMIKIKTTGIECSSPMGARLIKFKDFLKGEFNDWVKQNFPEGTLEEIKFSVKNLDKIPGIIKEKNIVKNHIKNWKSIPINKRLEKFFTKECKIYKSLKNSKEEHIQHNGYFYKVSLDSIEIRNIKKEIVFPIECLKEKMDIGTKIRILDIQICDGIISAYYENYFYEGNDLDRITSKKGYLEISPQGFISRYSIKE